MPFGGRARFGFVCPIIFIDCAGNTGSESTTSPSDLLTCSNECKTSCIWRTLLHETAQKPSRSSTLTTTTESSVPKDSLLLHHDFLKKYVYFARHHVVATLSEDACQSIANSYVDLRAQADERTLPVFLGDMWRCIPGQT